METTMRDVPTADRDDRRAAEPLPLPFEALPFEDGSDEAVPFVLTAAAHREVLGRDVPPLVAVPASGSTSTRPVGAASPDDEPNEARRAQARALLHSGMPVTTIAAALGVEVGLVERWTADLVDELARRRRRGGRRVQGSPSPVTTPDVLADDAAIGAEERQRLLPGLAFVIAEVDGDMVTLMHDRIAPVALLLDALRELDAVPAGRLRVAVRIAADLPADRTRAEVAARLGVDAATITVGRSGPGIDRGIELRVDLRDATAAAQVRAWGARDRELRGWDSNPQTFRLTADCSAS
jgi:hypothetical protein